MVKKTPSKLLAMTCISWAAIGAMQPTQAADFSFAGAMDAYTLDPHAVSHTFIAGMLRNVYEPLVRRGRSAELEPALAESWRQIDDHTWEFKLRQGVKFHDGHDFTADDVVFSFERAKNGGVKSHLSAIQSIEKVDDHTIRLISTAPNPVLPNQIVNWFIMDKEWAEANNAQNPGSADNSRETYANRNANGTGPYRITERDPGVKTVFESNPDWWMKPEGNVTQATYYVIPNPATRVSALLSGKVDLVDNLPPQDTRRVSEAKGFKVAEGNDLRVIYLQPDVLRKELLHGTEKDKNPFQDLRVRQAMQLAIDTSAIQQRVMRGYSTPIGLPIGQEVNGYDPVLGAPIKADVEQARKLMQEAGYADGFGVSLDCTNDRFMNDEATCLAVAASLSRIGIRVGPRVQVTSRWAQQVNPPQYNTSLALLGYSPFTYDAQAFLTAIAASRQPDNGLGAFNIGGYANPEVDALITRIGTEADPATRTALIKEAMGKIRNDVAFIPIHQLKTLWGVKDGIEVWQSADLGYPLDHFKVPE